VYIFSENALLARLAWLGITARDIWTMDVKGNEERFSPLFYTIMMQRFAIAK
jgi:hypothetical protein